MTCCVIRSASTANAATPGRRRPSSASTPRKFCASSLAAVRQAPKHGRNDEDRERNRHQPNKAACAGWLVERAEREEESRGAAGDDDAAEQQHAHDHVLKLRLHHLAM